MTLAATAQTTGRFGWMRAVLVTAGLALLLTSTSLPVGAETRDEARQQANGFIDTCFNDLGGEPSVSESDDDGITVTCAVGDTVVGCNWVGGGGWGATCWDLGTPDILFEQPDLVPIDLGNLPHLRRVVVDDLRSLEPDDPGKVVTAPGASARELQHSSAGPGDHDKGKGKAKGNGKKGGKGRK